MFPRFYECIEMHDVMTSGAGESNSDKIGSEEGFDKYFALSIKRMKSRLMKWLIFELRR